MIPPPAGTRRTLKCQSRKEKYEESATLDTKTPFQNMTPPNKSHLAAIHQLPPTMDSSTSVVKMPAPALSAPVICCSDGSDAPAAAPASGFCWLVPPAVGGAGPGAKPTRVDGASPSA